MRVGKMSNYQKFDPKEKDIIITEAEEYFIKAIRSADEPTARRIVAQRAIESGYGGVSRVSKITGMSRNTIVAGIKELKIDQESFDKQRQRRPGGGRKRLEDITPQLVTYLNKHMENATAGDPMSELRWTSQSLTSIADCLKKNGFSVSHTTVGRLLKEQGYALYGNKKNIEGKPHPDRVQQFRIINDKVNQLMSKQQPVISVDTKKKELIGNYKNAGSVWCDSPRDVNVYDFLSDSLGRAIPYGIYDVAMNAGLVNVGKDHDTAEFAVNSILVWWRTQGQPHYSKAQELLICADGGGSNGSRVRLWKVALQKFADLTGLIVHVCHYPPGTSKWNKIEYRMFSQISIAWRGKPLETFETVVNLIANTTNKSGLQISAVLDENIYHTGIKISDDEMELLSLEKHPDLPAWNYTISPRFI